MILLDVQRQDRSPRLQYRLWFYLPERAPGVALARVARNDASDGIMHVTGFGRIRHEVIVPTRRKDDIRRGRCRDRCAGRLDVIEVCLELSLAPRRSLFFRRGAD